MSKRTIYIQPMSRYVVWENPLTDYKTTSLERLRPNLSFWKTKIESDQAPATVLKNAVQAGKVIRGGWVRLEVEDAGWHFADLWPQAMEKLKHNETIDVTNLN